MSAGVSVHGLGKSFYVPRHGAQTLKERALHPLRGGADELVALRDVSFEVGSGEFFAVIGRNGSGKSTLLKCIAGIYEPQRGSVEAGGRIAPLIELGVGFNPELNAVDNVLVNATLMGLSPVQARERLPRIIEFAELEEFTEMKLRNYSSGMRMRLGFATAIQVEAEVLLIDEVLAVGDARVPAQVPGDVSRDEVRGPDDRPRLAHSGARPSSPTASCCSTTARSPRSATRPKSGSTYQRRNRARQLEAAGANGEVARLGDGSAEIVDAWLEDASGRRTTRLPRGERVRVAVRAGFKRDHDDPVIGFYVTGENRVLVMHLNSRLDGEKVGPVRAGEMRTLRTSFENWLGGGIYSLSPYVAHPDGTEAEVVDQLLGFEVDAEVVLGSLLDPPRETRIEEG